MAPPVFDLVRPQAFFARLGRDTKIGFGEAYMAGDWRAAEGTDLADLLTPFASRLTSLVPEPLQRLRMIVDQTDPAEPREHPRGSRNNISAHYDLSNELFGAFLDPTMSYSAAWFDESESVVDRDQARGGAASQDRRSPGLRGGRAGDPAAGDRHRMGSTRHPCRAARRPVTTVTISAEQLALATERVEAGRPVRPSGPATTGLPRGRG